MAVVVVCGEPVVKHSEKNERTKERQKIQTEHGSKPGVAGGGAAVKSVVCR